MAQTYADLQEQIAKLQNEAQRVRKEELSSVIARLRADVKTYELTPQDLFGKVSSKAPKGKAGASATPKFSDGKGNHWVGRGPRPQWLRDALAAGKKLEEFVFGAAAAKAEPAPAPVAKAAPKKTAAKKAAAPKAVAKKTRSKASSARK